MLSHWRALERSQLIQVQHALKDQGMDVEITGHLDQKTRLGLIEFNLKYDISDLDVISRRTEMKMGVFL